MAEKLVCVSLIEETLTDMLSEAEQTEADLVELRLDYLKKDFDTTKIREIEKPVIATCMPNWEGGLFAGSEKERIKLLEESLPYIQYITIELNTEEKLRDDLIKKAKDAKVKVIVAFHDFEKTPSLDEIKKILGKESDACADVAKVAFMPKNTQDVLNVIKATVESDSPSDVITLSMGELGKASRIVCPLLGSMLTYASASENKKAAAGQLTVRELKKVFTSIS